jgi:hypothetical protein
VISGVICRGPQGLEPASLLTLGGTLRLRSGQALEAVPFPFVAKGGAVKGITDGCDEKIGSQKWGSISAELERLPFTMWLTG